MKILGLDYGKNKVGVAFADGPLADPIKVIRYANIDDLILKIKEVSEEFSVEKIVVGVSEGKMGEESLEFAKKIGAETVDETLSTVDAQNLSREAGIPQKKRHEMEDAYAAAIILQNYIDALA